MLILFNTDFYIKLNFKKAKKFIHLTNLNNFEAWKYFFKLSGHPFVFQ